VYVGTWKNLNAGTLLDELSGHIGTYNLFSNFSFFILPLDHLVAPQTIIVHVNADLNSKTYLQRVTQVYASLDATPAFESPRRVRRRRSIAADGDAAAHDAASKGSVAHS
jgi:hypothetical protein